MMMPKMTIDLYINYKIEIKEAFLVFRI